MNKTARNSMIYLGGTIVMGLLGFASTMLLTRVLSQQIYAMYGLLTTFVSAADMFIAFGYDQSYMRFYYDHDRGHMGFLWQCIKVPLALFVLFAVVVVEPGQRLICWIFGEKLTLAALAALLAQVFFSNTHRFGQLTARMGENAGNYVLSNLVSKSGFVAMIPMLAAVFGDVSFEWVLLSMALMSLTAAAINLAAFRRTMGRSNADGKSVTDKELLRYGFPYMINNVLLLLIPMLEKIIIRKMGGWEILGIFTAASIFQTVVLLVLNAVTNIWNPLVYKHCGNEALFKPILHTFGMVGTVILALGTTACILLRRWLVLLLDEKYYTVYIIAPVVLVAACFNILSAIYSVGINIRKKTIHFVVAPLLQIVSSITLCYLLIPSMGLTGVGIANLVSIGLSRFYRILVGLHYYDTGASETKAFLLCAVCTAAAAASMFLTALRHDLLISGALLVLICIIINKDFVPLARAVIGFVRPSSTKK